MTTKTPEPQYRATMARNGRKGAGRKLSAKRKAALARATKPQIAWDDLEPVIDWIEEFPVHWRHINKVTKGRRHVERITRSRYAPEGKRHATEAQQRKTG